jgi:tRNA-dihydrouridine synthase
VSVKTRIGYSKEEEMEKWLLSLLDMELPVITFHARTKKEMSKVPAHWDKIAEAVKIRDREKSKTLILGNGDIKNRAEGLQKIQETGADGVMIGRGAFGNPWLFRPGWYEPTLEERFTVMLEHAETFDKMYHGIKSFMIMRKHFKAYCSGFAGAAELRAKFMETQNIDEVKNIAKTYLAHKI